MRCCKRGSCALLHDFTLRHRCLGCKAPHDNAPCLSVAMRQAGRPAHACVPLGRQRAGNMQDMSWWLMGRRGCGASLSSRAAPCPKRHVAQRPKAGLLGQRAASCSGYAGLGDVQCTSISEHTDLQGRRPWPWHGVTKQGMPSAGPSCVDTCVHTCRKHPSPWCGDQHHSGISQSLHDWPVIALALSQNCRPFRNALS